MGANATELFRSSATLSRIQGHSASAAHQGGERAGPCRSRQSDRDEKHGRCQTRIQEIDERMQQLPSPCRGGLYRDTRSNILAFQQSAVSPRVTWISFADIALSFFAFALEMAAFAKSWRRE